tara:strand:- start:2498 stop:2776 length:279 start_codon:yes stop_codon:yes gene_type:complete
MQQAILYVTGEGMEKQEYPVLGGHTLMIKRIIKEDQDTSEARALLIAYYETEKKEPGDLKTVEMWALRKKIVVDAVWEDVDPFNLGQKSGYS